MNFENIIFKEDQIVLIKEVAFLFKENRDRIVVNWCTKQDCSSPKFEAMKKGIEMLVDDFIRYLSNKDIVGYLKGNSIIGGEISSEDVSYDLFIDSFHDFEDSYINILKANYGENILKPLGTLDKLHHKTISILAEEYFKIKDATIFAVAKLADSRDTETGAHLERTRGYVKIIAECLGYNDGFVQNIYDVSPLHDIGKVGIPDRILLKQGPLTKEEFEIIKTHTKIGGDTLNSVIGNLEITRGNLVLARDLAYSHHENFDGSGYYKLAREDIPLAARIFTIGDIYDALTSKRPYKQAFPHEKAVEIIIKGDGRTMPEHFDPKVLDAFKRSTQLFFETSQRYKEQ